MPVPRLPALVVIACIALLAACSGGNGDDPAPTPEASPTTAATATPTPPPDDVLIPELEALVFETVPEEARGEPSDFEGISGVRAFRMPAAPDLFAAVTVGRPNFDPFYPHFAAIYRYSSPGEWQELSRVDLTSVEFIDFSSLEIVEIEPEGQWLLVRGSVGVHGTAMMLLRFANDALTVEVEHIADAAMAGRPVGDLNGDGAREVVLDTSNYYVFCYACSVVKWQATVLAWDGAAMVPLELEELPASSAAAGPNNELVELATAGRLIEASRIIEANPGLRVEDDTFDRNAVIVEQTLVLYAQNSTNPAYPLLHDVFAGDWMAAADRLRELDAAEVFTEGSPLVAGTVAEGYEPQLSAAVVGATDAALAVEPDLADLHLLRAWGLSLTDPADPAIAEELALAADLAPTDTFITGALGLFATE